MPVSGGGAPRRSARPHAAFGVRPQLQRARPLHLGLRDLRPPPSTAQPCNSAPTHAVKERLMV
eukprot:7249243-Prymnesium_polylepis.1